MNSVARQNQTDTAETFEFEVNLPGRDALRLRFDIVEGEIKNAALTVIGCPELLELADELRPKLNGRLERLPMPAGDGHAAILVRELILRAQGKWDIPYKEDELCHCRAVPTAKVDAAIVGGAHTVSAVSRRTSAGTSCGTCQADIKALLSYRLSQKP